MYDIGEHIPQQQQQQQQQQQPGFGYAPMVLAQFEVFYFI